MKEKRYKLESYNDAFSEVLDTESDEWYIRKDLIVDLLNAQDKEIKKLCQQIIDLNKENNDLRKFRDDILRVQAEPYQLYEENQQLKERIEQLKQSQKQLAISEFEKLRDFFLEYHKDKEMGTDWLITKDASDVASYVLDKIQELKGEQK